MGKYYDGTKLLSMTDINGNKPEIYMCTTNRTGGKTTYFGRLCINRFLDKGEKFGLIYRYNYELDDVVDKFYKDLGSLFFKEHEMTSKRRASGIFHELFLDENLALAKKAAADGIDGTITIYPGMSHDFALLMPDLQDSVKSFAEIRDFVKRHMHK